MEKGTKLILALDLDEKEAALKIVDRLKDYIRIFKVGAQLFTAHGTDIVKMIQEKGVEVFLDLKYHDIPATVARAAAAATQLGVYIYNLHILGGVEMMKKAKEATVRRAEELKIRKPIILGVTILTSLDDNVMQELRIEGPVKERVVQFASLARSAGIDGVVSSPKEIKFIRQKCGNDFIILTPGVRHQPHFTLTRDLMSKHNDHKRTLGVADAVRDGANFIVVGRPILEAHDPVKATQEILQEMRAARSIEHRA
jgi:orotidine-5'-phosphate decarboxylase